MSYDNADPDVRNERYTPETEKILRQFLTLESGNYVTRALRRNYDTAINGSEPLVCAAPCSSCEYVAHTVAEIHWHEDRNHGHECCPDNHGGPPVEMRCRVCGRASSENCEHISPRAP